MPSRTYAQIECSLTSSKRLRGLSDHKTRWAYLCAHLSDYCTYTGLFRYPSHMWAHDAQVTVEELEEVIDELRFAGLIEREPDEEFVRIVGWFHKRSGPDNPNRVDGIITDLSVLDCPSAEILCGAVAELVVASMRRSLRWKQDAPGRQQLYTSLKTFLAEVYQDYGDLFLAHLSAELDAAPSIVSGELKAIFPVFALTPTDLPSKGSERVTPTLPEHETRRNVDEKKKKKDLNLNETAIFDETASLQSQTQTEKPDMLRKGEGPTISAINSTIAQAARKTG